MKKVLIDILLLAAVTLAVSLIGWASAKGADLPRPGDVPTVKSTATFAAASEVCTTGGCGTSASYSESHPTRFSMTQRVRERERFRPVRMVASVFRSRCR